MSKIDTGDKELDEALTLEGELKGLVASLLEDDVPVEDIIETLIEALDIENTREAIGRLESAYRPTQEDEN